MSSFLLSMMTYFQDFHIPAKSGKCSGATLENWGKHWNFFEWYKSEVSCVFRTFVRSKSFITSHKAWTEEFLPQCVIMHWNPILQSGNKFKYCGQKTAFSIFSLELFTQYIMFSKLRNIMTIFQSRGCIYIQHAVFFLVSRGWKFLQLTFNKALSIHT